MMTRRISANGVQTSRHAKPARAHSANKTAAKPAIMSEMEAPLVEAAPGKGTMELVGEEVAVGAAPVPLIVAAVVVEQLSCESGLVMSLKLAQLMRVLLAKWKTKLRLPKKEPGPSTMER